MRSPTHTQGLLTLYHAAHHILAPHRAFLKFFVVKLVFGALVLNSQVKRTCACATCLASSSASSGIVIFWSSTRGHSACSCIGRILPVVAVCATILNQIVEGSRNDRRAHANGTRKRSARNRGVQRKERGATYHKCCAPLRISCSRPFGKRKGADPILTEKII